MARLNAVKDQLSARMTAFQDQMNDRVDVHEQNLVDHDTNINTDLINHDTNIDTDLDDLSTRVGTPDTTLPDTDLDDLSTRVGTPDTTLPDTDLSDQIASIYRHSNPEPFEVTIETCVNLGVEAGLQGAIFVETEGKVEGSLGVDAYGNGASVEIRIQFWGFAHVKLGYQSWNRDCGMLTGRAGGVRRDA